MRPVIVRLFEPAAEAGEAGLCGVVEDVRTGSRWPFRDGQQLLRLLARATAVPASGGRPVSPPE